MSEKQSSVISEKESAGSYAQLFIYRVPKKNHDAMVLLQKQLTGIYRKHGTLLSEFFQLNLTEAFEGFTSIAKTVPIVPDEELWVELERYKDRGHRDKVVKAVGQDENAGPLFGQFMGLVSQEHRMIMGDFERIRV
jgi:uncharacterized protein YbaA (DUF1428 family)